MVYTSILNEKIKNIKKLNSKKYRDRENMFLVEGEHLVLEAYKTGYLSELLLEENEVFPLDTNISYVSNNVLSYISELESAPLMIGVCKKKEPSPIYGDHILVLDDIQDPGNLGTIIRSAVAFHIDTILISNKTVDIYNSKAIRASQGMLFHINIKRCELEDELVSLKDNGYKILGTKVTHGKSLKGIEKMQKFAIIMGNEGAGMSDKLESLCDSNIYIDMNGACESLNVGVATSIILYELDK